MSNNMKILLRSPRFIFGLVILVTLLLFTFIYPSINKNDPKEIVGMLYQSPNEELILGTDNLGRDVLLELAYGSKTSLYVGLIAGGIATAIGLTLGLLAGYVGGTVDNIITSVANLFTVIPSFVILVLISVSISTRSSTVSALVIGFTAWPWTTRSVRAQTVSLRNRDHVNIAKISGYSTPRIIVSEILPYIASYVVMAFILQIASGILTEASISIIGLGPSGIISLGEMMNRAVQFEAHLSGSWWAFIPTAFMISGFTFSLYMMNSGMDEIFNPKIRS